MEKISAAKRNAGESGRQEQWMLAEGRGGAGDLVSRDAQRSAAEWHAMSASEGRGMLARVKSGNWKLQSEAVAC